MQRRLTKTALKNRVVEVVQASTVPLTTQEVQGIVEKDFSVVNTGTNRIAQYLRSGKPYVAFDKQLGRWTHKGLTKEQRKKEKLFKEA